MCRSLGNHTVYLQIHLPAVNVGKRQVLSGVHTSSLFCLPVFRILNEVLKCFLQDFNVIPIKALLIDLLVPKSS